MGGSDGIYSVVLKCPNCGANLTITPDMDVLACGYCGSQQVVRREGGTVSLRLIEETVLAVRETTDRIAAELVLARLERGFAALDAELAEWKAEWDWFQQWSRDASGRRADPRRRNVLLVTIFLVWAPAFAYLFSVEGAGVCISCVVPFVVAFFGYKVADAWFLSGERAALIRWAEDLDDRRARAMRQIHTARMGLGLEAGE